jgi:hypothetical protein
LELLAGHFSGIVWHHKRKRTQQLTTRTRQTPTNQSRQAHPTTDYDQFLYSLRQLSFSKLERHTLADDLLGASLSKVDWGHCQNHLGESNCQIIAIAGFDEETISMPSYLSEETHHHDGIVEHGAKQITKHYRIEEEMKDINTSPITCNEGES